MAFVLATQSRPAWLEIIHVVIVSKDSKQKNAMFLGAGQHFQMHPAEVAAIARSTECASVVATKGRQHQ